MDQDHRRLYKALTARDSRFDGVFFVGVTSTGIYCRPICPVKTPKAANCRFFDTPQEAEQAGFRPCLRCRPELAPGSAPVDDAQRIAQLIVQRLEEGQLDEKAGLEAIADQFELSSRQIRRIVQKELGVPPIQLLLTRRLLLAKQLLTETTLPITEVAFASGFSSLRRFNDAFNTRYGMPPTRLRKKATDGATRDRRAARRRRCSSRIVRRTTGRASSRFWPPARSTGIEHVTDGSYARTVQLGRGEGLDQGDAVEEEARADGRVHAQPDAGAAGAAQPRAGAVRSQRAARPDREASAQGRAPGARRSRRTPACECPAPSTDSRWACARSSASR